MFPASLIKGEDGIGLNQLSPQQDCAPAVHEPAPGREVPGHLHLDWWLRRGAAQQDPNTGQWTKEYKRQMASFFCNKYESKLWNGLVWITAVLPRRSSKEKWELYTCYVRNTGVRASWCKTINMLTNIWWRSNICYCSLIWCSLDIIPVYVWSYCLLGTSYLMLACWKQGGTISLAPPSGNKTHLPQCL